MECLTIPIKNHSIVNSLRHCKGIPNLLYWVLWAWLATHIYNDSINLKKPWCLSVGKKSTSTFTFSLRYCKDIAKLIFWVFWSCFNSHTQCDNINLQKTFVFIYREKINYIPNVFLDILQRYAKLYVLIISRTHFRVNPHSIVAWMSRNSLLKADTKSEV